MPVELRVIRASEFVRLNADEHLDFEATKETLRALAVVCRKRGLGCAMVDLRMLPVPTRPLFTMTELTQLVGTFREAGFSRHQRLAILFQHDVHGGIRNFAFLSAMRGLKVQAFKEFEAALFWLSEKPAISGPRRPQGVRIPITTRAGRAGKLPTTLSARSSGSSKARPARKAAGKKPGKP